MVTALGGLGLFLLGMLLLTDGVKALAGRALKSVLTRFVRGPVTALATGAGLTALIQSSSATTLTTIGFVSAGLITFRQAVGVVFGANIGTTSTGWLVSVLGFKVSLGAVALPMVFVGAMLRLVGRGRVAHAGLALAGFGLLFFGIDMLAEGMAGVSARIDPSALPGSGIGGRALLVGAGVVMTVLMQSSSAAMAVTLAALHTGGVDIGQAAALVIGQNIGTTVTAAIAGVGGSTAAKRTALAHILFNVITGFVAFLVLPVFEWSVARWFTEHGGRPDVALLAGFHTGFNVLGVAMLLPAIGPFSRLVERIVPERGSAFTRNLDPSVARLGDVAIEAARRSLLEVLAVEIGRSMAALHGRKVGREEAGRFEDARASLARVGDFVADIGVATSDPRVTARQVDLVHAVDHLSELGETVVRLLGESDAVGDASVARTRAAVGALLVHVNSAMDGRGPEGGAPALFGEAAGVAEERRRERAALLEAAARHGRSAEDTAVLIDTVRRIDALGYHATRAAAHLMGWAGADVGAAVPAR